MCQVKLIITLIPPVLIAYINHNNWTGADIKPRGDVEPPQYT